MSETQSQNVAGDFGATRRVQLSLSDLQLTTKTSSVPLNVRCSVVLELPLSLNDTTLHDVATLVDTGNLWLMKAAPCQMDVSIHVYGCESNTIEHLQWLTNSVETCPVWDDLRITIRKQEQDTPHSRGLEGVMTMSFVINHPHLLSESLASTEMPHGRFLGLKIAFIYGQQSGDSLPMSPLRKRLPEPSSLKPQVKPAKTSKACDKCRAKKRRCDGTAMSCKKHKQPKSKNASAKKMLPTPDTQRQIGLRTRPRTRASGRIRYGDQSDSDMPDGDGPNYDPFLSPSRRALRKRSSTLRTTGGGSAPAVQDQEATEYDMAKLVKAALYKLFGFKKAVSRIRIRKELEGPNLLDIAPAVWNMPYLRELNSRVMHIPWIASCFATLNAESPSLQVKLATLINGRDAAGAQLVVERKLHQLAHRGLDIPPPAPSRSSPSLSDSQIRSEPGDESQPIVISDDDVYMEPYSQDTESGNCQFKAVDVKMEELDDDLSQIPGQEFDFSQEVEQDTDLSQGHSVFDQQDEAEYETLKEMGDSLPPSKTVEQEIDYGQGHVMSDQLQGLVDEQIKGSGDGLFQSTAEEMALEQEQEDVVPKRLVEAREKLMDAIDDEITAHETGHLSAIEQLDLTHQTGVSERLDELGVERMDVAGDEVPQADGHRMDLEQEDIARNELHGYVGNMEANRQGDGAPTGAENGVLRSVVQLGWRWAARIF